MFRALFSVILLALGILVFGARPVSGAATEARTGQASAPALPAHRSLSALSPAEETLASPSELDLRNESLLATTEVPGRDIISLTKRLKLRNLSVNIPALVNRSTPNYRVGTSQRFYVANMLQKGYYTIYATVRAITPHAYWYIKNGYHINLQRLQSSANWFETHIYPTDRRVFGSEAMPGIDNDPRITILIAPIPGVGGYFSAADAYPKLVNPYSNERDMIYMGVVPEDPSGDPANYFESTLAHEFQHMIEWNMNRNREVWLDEGCSEIASYLNGYDIGGTDYDFSQHSNTQLDAWSDIPDSPPHYGASYLFLRYLMDHFGGDRFISSLVKQKGSGTNALDSAIRAAGSTGGFDGAFEDWTVANVLNDRSVAGGRFAYSEGGTIKPSKEIASYPATRRGTVHEYAADYIHLSGSLPSGTITFKGSPNVPITGAGAYTGQMFWYSNRRDLGDSTLTRQFDLTRVRTATLHFWAWFDIEDGFDYAYLSASTDGGSTWTTLRGKHTTQSNPNGANYGNGWTGKSGVPAGSPLSARWVEEGADLSTYAGKRVLLRFEYITDEGYNRPGLAVDDLSIPEIGYRDDAETDNGWSAQGFIRIGSKMPQRWFVALIERGSPNSVRQMRVDADGNGTIDLTPLSGGGSRDATLVIAPLAPKTTELATYTVTVTSRR